MLGVFSVSLGVLITLALVMVVIYFYLKDITQKKHAILRNFPLIGRLRYFLNNSGNTSGNTFSWVIAMSDLLIAQHAAGFIAWPK